MRAQFAHGGVRQNEAADGTAEIKNFVGEGCEIRVVDAHAVKPHNGEVRRAAPARPDGEKLLGPEGRLRLLGGFCCFFGRGRSGFFWSG